MHLTGLKWHMAMYLEQTVFVSFASFFSFWESRLQFSVQDYSLGSEPVENKWITTHYAGYIGSEISFL